MEHERTTETRATGLHLGNHTAKILTWKGFDNWIVEAAGREHWMLLKRDFVFFTLHNS